jgi:hypothetical protein
LPTDQEEEALTATERLRGRVVTGFPVESYGDAPAILEARRRDP